MLLRSFRDRFVIRGGRRVVVRQAKASTDALMQSVGVRHVTLARLPEGTVSIMRVDQDVTSWCSATLVGVHYDDLLEVLYLVIDTVETVVTMEVPLDDRTTRTIFRGFHDTGIMIVGTDSDSGWQLSLPMAGRFSPGQRLYDVLHQHRLKSLG